MTTTSELLSRNKSVVHAFYEGAGRRDFSAFLDLMRSDFVLYAPAYLPWGGIHHGAAHYLQVVVPLAMMLLDYSRFRCESVTAEGDRVVTCFEVGIAGTRHTVQAIQQWEIVREKAVSQRVAYFEPETLMACARQLSLEASVPTMHRSVHADSFMASAAGILTPGMRSGFALATLDRRRGEAM